jgi:hypothetical protein
MAEHRGRSKRSQAPARGSPTVEFPLPGLGVLVDVRETFHELCIQTG